MDNVNALAPHILTWLLNYLVHSTILLGLAVITHQFGILKPRRSAEQIWRAALFGGVVTASLQLGLQLALHAPEIKNVSVSREQLIAAPSASFSPEVSEVSISDKHVSEASSITARSLPNDSTINTQFSENIVRDSDNKVITLPANLQNIISALILTWILYGVFSILKILHAVRQLNRMANAMPVVNRSDLNELLSKYLPHSNNIARLRVSRDLNSPFVCPNGVICMPSWVLEQCNQALCLAMLHHEIQHIIRRDGAWRIAHEFMKKVFFFQILNRVADKQLSLLAEIDCDRIAVKANGVDTFAQALVRCAEMAVASKHPTFAIPMANSTSLIQRIDFILDEDNMNNTQSDIRKHKAIGIILSLLAAAITIVAPTTSIAFINTNNSSTISLPAPSSKHDASTSATKVEKTLVLSSIVTTSDIKPSKTIVSTLGLNNQTTNIKAVQVEVPTLSSQVSNPQQLLTQAKQAFENKNYAQAFKIYSELADANNAEAQAMKGEMLWYGDGIATDPAAAKIWLAKAAAQGNPKAQEFTKMFAEREKRLHELNFYTTQFDGGSLKWEKQTCEAATKIDSILECYNNYIATITQGLASANYIPTDLNQIMRAEEIEKSKHLARTVLFQQGLLAKSDVENRLASLKRQLYDMNDFRLESIRREYDALRNMSKHTDWTMVDGTPVAKINNLPRNW